MSNPRFARLGSVMRGQAEVPAPAMKGAVDPMPDTEPDDDDADEDRCEGGEKSNKKEKPMADEKTHTAADVAQARADERARFSTVLASEHFAGREALAQSLLATDLAADAIVTALAAAPKAEASEAEPTDPDAAARAEMRDALAESGNSNVDANAGAKPAAAQADNGAVWDRAIANITPGRKAA